MPPNEKLNTWPNVYWTAAATCMNIYVGSIPNLHGRCHLTQKDIHKQQKNSVIQTDHSKHYAHSRSATYVLATLGSKYFYDKSKLNSHAI